jgi:hypothetical protein
VTAPIGDAARARLVAAYAACALAELARAAVPVEPGSLHADGTPVHPGAVRADAGRVLAAAHRFVDAAVACERAGGAGWEEVEARLHGGADPFRGRWQAHAARDPLDAALDLDDWVRRHRDGDGDLGDAPVSAELLRASLPSRDRVDGICRGAVPGWCPLPHLTGSATNGARR